MFPDRNLSLLQLASPVTLLVTLSCIALPWQFLNHIRPFIATQLSS